MNSDQGNGVSSEAAEWREADGGQSHKDMATPRQRRGSVLESDPLADQLFASDAAYPEFDDADLRSRLYAFLDQCVTVDEKGRQHPFGTSCARADDATSSALMAEYTFPVPRSR